MSELSEKNVKQTGEYNKFLEQIWELGNGDIETSQNVIRELLESPDHSMNLMSAFYYYNPTNGEILTTRPNSFI